MNRRSTVAALSAAAVLSLAPLTAAAQDITLTLHHFLGPKAPAQTQMLEPWAERIMADSGGRVEIEIYPSMSLGGAPPQLIRQVADGVVDIVWTVNGYTPGLFPRTEVFELPTVFTNDPAATNLAIAEMADDLAPEYENVHVLWRHVHAGQALQMADQPVRTPDDLAGLKLRSPSAAMNAVIEALGATPVAMPVPDLPQALSTGAVDGALIPWEIIPALQLQETTQYQIEGPDSARFGGLVFQVSMNKDRWDELPDDIKAVFDRNTGPEWLAEVGRIWRDVDDAGIAVATGAGNEHIVLTAEEMAAFNAKLEPVVEAWIAAHPDIDGRALVEQARALIAKHAGGA